ncbi:MAG TPA: DUF1634 domain-containing protein [Gemmatimonadaceae bacterium]|nr:DUF1634 domain-containing protein [Gemmatimonadaceae bacterium]
MSAHPEPLARGGEPPGPPARARWTDEQVEQVLGGLLRTGVLIAAAVAILGGAIFLAQHGMQVAGHRVFVGAPPELRSIAGIARGVLALQSAAIVQLGLLLLIATPVARVALSLVAFLIQRDRLYVVITGIVLLLLLFSLNGGPA